ncbi:MAG: ATP dependent DNA ligase [Devosia sp.]
MASRPIWKGQLRLSLVSIPVEIYTATQASAKPSFRQIHEPTGKPINYEKVVAGVGPVDRDEIKKGFEYEKGDYALRVELDRRARKTSPFVNAPRDISRHARWVDPELVGEIAFTEFTPDGYLRHPSFIGPREDKPARSIGMEKPAIPCRPKPNPSHEANKRASGRPSN